MFFLEHIIAGAMLVALTIYVLSGGADYGGGVWDLFASGPRKVAQQKLIKNAIGPIWEADHVWLILAIVLLFTAFPSAYARITTALHIPLMIMLVGIVLRGSAFTFRTYSASGYQKHWGLVFAIASMVTPIAIGIVIGAISSGNITFGHNNFWLIFMRPWLAPFPIAVGIFALCLFAFLAAVYLTVEAKEKELQEDFKVRALVSGVFVGVMALVVFSLAGNGAPFIREALVSRLWTWPLHIGTALLAIGAFFCLWTNRFRTAALCAAGQVTLIVWGWAFAQYPFLVQPNISIYTSAAPESVLKLLIAALACGAFLLFPSFYYLFYVFKRSQIADPDQI
jgi:cytochrome d ubiquinol oxidase subunit II